MPLNIIAEWRGNTAPGRLVASVGNDLTMTGSPLWPTAADVPGCEGDHWLIGATNLNSPASHTADFYAMPMTARPGNVAWEISYLINSSAAVVIDDNVLHVYFDTDNPDSSGRRYFLTYVNSGGQLEVEYTDSGGGDNTVHATTSIGDSAPHAIVVTGGIGLGIKIYVDGVLEGSSGTDVDFGTGSQPYRNDPVHTTLLQYISLEAGGAVYLDDIQISNDFYTPAPPTPTPPTPPPTPVVPRQPVIAFLNQRLLPNGKTLTIFKWGQAILDVANNSLLDGLFGYRVYRTTSLNLEDPVLIKTISTLDHRGFIDTAFTEIVATGFVQYGVAAFNAAGESQMAVVTATAMHQF